MWQGSKVLWNETRGRKFHGTFVPVNESSTLWNFRPRGRKFPGTKVPDTDMDTESPQWIVILKPLYQNRINCILVKGHLRSIRLFLSIEKRNGGFSSVSVHCHNFLIFTYLKHTVNVILHHSASLTFVFVTKHFIQHLSLIIISVAFLPRDAPSAKRYIAIACRLSVPLSVCLSVRLSVRLWRWWIVIT